MSRCECVFPQRADSSRWNAAKDSGVVGMKRASPALALRLLRAEAADVAPAGVDPEAVARGVRVEDAHGGDVRERVVTGPAVPRFPRVAVEVDKDPDLGPQGLEADGLGEEVPAPRA